MSSTTPRDIITAATDFLARLASEHADSAPYWASREAHAAHTPTYTDVRFTPLGEHAVLATTPKGRTMGAAEALDYAGGNLDNGDGYISTDVTESLVIYYLSSTPGIASIIAEATR